MKKFFYYILLLIASVFSNISNATTVMPFVDVLAWKASETNTSWATTFTFPENSKDVTQSYLNFNTAPAFKTGIIISPNNNFWDTTFYWTHFYTTSKDNISLNDKILTSLFFSGSFFISDDLFFGANANWKLLMNMFDLQVSHGFKPLPSLTLTPKIGVKGGSINQSININWDAILYASTEKVINNFSGIGPSFGVNGRWNFYKELNFIGDISTALMYGRWNVSDVYQRPEALFGILPSTTISTKMNQSKLGSFMMDYYVGLEWLHQDKVTVAMRLGYEAQYWASQFRATTVEQLPTMGDLTLQGATCGISVGF